MSSYSLLKKFAFLFKYTNDEDWTKLEDSLRKDPENISIRKSYFEFVRNLGGGIKPSVYLDWVFHTYRIDLKLYLKSSRLNISNNEKIKDLKWLSGFSLPKLKTLAFVNTGLTTLNGIQDFEADSLRHLFILNNKNLVSLEGLEKFDAPNISDVVLSGNRISTEMLLHFIKNNPDNLISNILRNNYIVQN